MKTRIPITAITVFGSSGMVAVSVAIVLYLGFGQAAESTRQLWADQSETLILAMEESLDARLKPVREQARWVARDVQDVSSLTQLDEYMFGVLAATPLVAGTAIILPEGNSRRWHRDGRVAISENWADAVWFDEYINQVSNTRGAAWRDPIFTETISTTSLLHDIPLYDSGGNFIGVFAQIVPVEELSAFVARNYSDTGITPFILYGRDSVLAHPALSGLDENQILPKLSEFGDLILKRIWSPDEEVLFISEALTDTQASGILWGDDYYLFLYRDITRYGPVPWTIGAYLNTTLAARGEARRILNALIAGIIVLIVAVLVSIIIGRKVSIPIKAIVNASNAVNAGLFDQVSPLRGSHIRELDDASESFNHMVHGLRERQLIRDTLGRFVPEKVASTLLAGGGELPVQETEATILFSDIESFTRLTEQLGPVKIVEVLNAYFSAMFDVLEKHDGVVTQFQGDAILATFNVPIADPDHALKALIAAQDMLASVEANEFAGESINIRVGINTGNVVAGAIGAHGRLNYTVHGDAVNLAARLEAMNKEYGTRLLISEYSIAHLPDLDFSLIGETAVRGHSQPLKFYTLESMLPERETS